MPHAGGGSSALRACVQSPSCLCPPLTHSNPSFPPPPHKHTHTPTRAQVTLLSSGYMMYSGEREGLVPWFSDSLGWPYDPAMHGLASDWVMDLVNVGFTKPEVRGGGQGKGGRGRGRGVEGAGGEGGRARGSRSQEQGVRRGGGSRSQCGRRGKVWVSVTATHNSLVVSLLL